MAQFLAVQVEVPGDLARFRLPFPVIGVATSVKINPTLRIEAP